MDLSVPSDTYYSPVLLSTDAAVVESRKNNRAHRVEWNGKDGVIKLLERRSHIGYMKEILIIYKGLGPLY